MILFVNENSEKITIFAKSAHIIKNINLWINTFFIWNKESKICNFQYFSY